ncbi:hypothetical protein GUJ93_ZPchr0014g46765 [Zizania palustris]|uniref:Uncharacterized protein n=1 Tax=Zizania palustris TaxID=103762 RepID=A0A8J5SV40_ZIZPA|nr:hypothetical protein GUJ93_ZPchr0014g46765 [Zizania palustris]
MSVTAREVRAAEPEASMPVMTDAVVAKEVATQVAPPLLRSPGDSGVEFLEMFEYTSSLLQSLTSARTGTFFLRSYLESIT